MVVSPPNKLEALLVSSLCVGGELSPEQANHAVKILRSSNSQGEDLTAALVRRNLIAASDASTLRMVEKGYLSLPNLSSLLRKDAATHFITELKDKLGLNRDETFTLGELTAREWFGSSFETEGLEPSELSGLKDFRPLANPRPAPRSDSRHLPPAAPGKAPAQPLTISRSPMPGPAPLPTIGDQLGKLLITELLGQGSSAKVFKALHQTLRIPVAVKVLLCDETSDAQSQLKTLQSEAQLLAQLNHPNILRVMDCDTNSGWPYLVLEYLEGSTLFELIEQSGRLQPRNALAILRGVVEGLAHATERGVIHRDVKPANILVSRNGAAKIADLGIAKMVQGLHFREDLAESMVLGTPAYVSPEQISGHADVDFRSDMYSLGATLFHTLTGSIPFEGPNIFEIMRHHIEEPAPLLSERCPGVSEPLTRFVDRLLAKNPDHRFASYQQLLNTLDALPEAQSARSTRTFLETRSQGLFKATINSPQTTSITASPSKASFSGNIGPTGAVEVIQFIGIASKTGVLRLSSSLETTEIFFERGEAVHACFGPVIGRPAFFEIVSLKDGLFEFYDGETGNNRSIQGSTMSLLMEAMRLIDERETRMNRSSEA